MLTLSRMAAEHHNRVSCDRQRRQWRDVPWIVAGDSRASYAATVARVQARALRNGEIFHLRGPMRLGRDLSLKLLGKRLLDMPWLYGYKI